MSRREDIDNAIWSDPDFAELSPEAKLVYIWSFTNQRCGMAGLYKFSLSQAASEIGLELVRFAAALEELGAADFAHCEQDVIWVRSRVRHIRTRTSQIARSIAKDVEKLSEVHPLRVRFLETYAAYPWLRDALADVLALGSGLAETANNREPHSRTSKGTSHKRFHGTGTGKGFGGVEKYTRAPVRDLRAWAAENVPELPADLVCMATGKLASRGVEVEADSVRRQVLAQYPHLAEGASASNLHPLPTGETT